MINYNAVMDLEQNIYNLKTIVRIMKSQPIRLNYCIGLGIGSYLALHYDLQEIKI